MAKETERQVSAFCRVFMEETGEEKRDIGVMSEECLLRALALYVTEHMPEVMEDACPETRIRKDR